MLYPDKGLDLGTDIEYNIGNRCGIDRSLDIIGKGSSNRIGNLKNRILEDIQLGIIFH